MPKPKFSERQRASNLRRTIDEFRYRYHVLNDPAADDSVYESLTRELRALEERFPELQTADSPTRRVGGERLERFIKVSHREPMLSLDDSFSFDELKLWLERISRIDKRVEKARLYCELKVDGLACSILYRNGLFFRAATRGDGLIGEDVTEQVRTIEAVPLRLRGRKRGEVEVRGEVYLPKKEFQKINREREKAGLPVFANPRNVAAGSVRQLDPKLTGRRHLSFIAYQLIASPKIQSHAEEHQQLEELGFRALTKENKMVSNIKAVISFALEVEKNRERLPFLIDGLVIRVDDLDLFDRLSVVGKAPRGAIAFKFAASQVTTRLKDIVVQVGRQGTLTPVAVLEPVELAGVTVSRATLHNQEEISKKDIMIGDTVVVQRAGDVIPEILEPIKKLRPKNAKRFRMPRGCPVCGERVLKDTRTVGKKIEPGVGFRCVNKDCPAVNRKRLYFFSSKTALDMPGLGQKIIDRLLDEGLIRDFADLFRLKVKDLEPLERFGELSAKNIIDSINARKTVSLGRFLVGLGIKGVGGETATLLAERFGDLSRLKRASKESLEAIPAVGPVVAGNIVQFFGNRKNQKLIGKLIEAGFRVEKEEKKFGRLDGKSFVFSGTISIPRLRAAGKIRALGGKVSASVSRTTDYLVVGKNPGLKYDQAKALSVEILNESAFRKLVGELAFD